MKSIVDFAEVAYFVFGVQLVASIWLFIRNRRAIRKMPLHRELATRLHPASFALPVAAALAVGAALVGLTGLLATSCLIAACLLTVFVLQWTLSPLLLKHVSTDADMRNESMREVISKGVRSRVFSIGICVNLLMMFYAFFNMA